MQIAGKIVICGQAAPYRKDNPADDTALANH